MSLLNVEFTWVVFYWSQLRPIIVQLLTTLYSTNPFYGENNMYQDAIKINASEFGCEVALSAGILAFERGVDINGIKYDHFTLECGPTSTGGQFVQQFLVRGHYEVTPNQLEINLGE
jgi:hypothetical protein